MKRWMRGLFLVTDVGFIAYWLTTLGKLLPAEWLFQGYGDATVASWNLSFMPLDMLVSATGLGSLVVAKRCPHASRVLGVVSLAATSISGLQAISFWALRSDFELAWWLPNLFLLIWPFPFLAWMALTAHREPTHGGSASPVTSS